MIKPFQLSSPATVAEASGELARLGEQGKIYAGGAELLLLLRHGLINAAHFIDVKGIPGLNEIRSNSETFHIGATVTHHQLETDAAVLQHLPMFADAEAHVANIRVRNQWTLGGNLCFNDPHSDPGTALLVYEAKVKLEGRNGAREMDLEEFLVGSYEIALGEDELLTAIDVSPLPSDYGSAYHSIHRYQRPTLGVAVAASWEGDRISGVRAAVGCVGPKPIRLKELETNLMGVTLEDAGRLCGDADASLRDLLQPVDDLLGSADYKMYMTRTFLVQGLEQASQGKNRKGHG